MVLYRVEHHETCAGPFQSEFYPSNVTFEDIAPDNWGAYIPSFDPCPDTHYDYKPAMRRWACHNRSDIMMMNTDEGKNLSVNGWILRTYEVPESCIFICKSGKQVLFDFACAKKLRTLCLVAFLLDREVEYVE